ncbi:MAG: hypothetical protein WAM85_10615 [Terracidiphilus sp.]
MSQPSPLLPDFLEKAEDALNKRVYIVTMVRGQVVKLRETQIALVEANEGIAVIPSFGMLACRNRKVTTSELIDPVVNLDFNQITSRGSRMSDEAGEFSALLKTPLSGWAGTSRDK